MNTANWITLVISFADELRKTACHKMWNHAPGNLKRTLAQPYKNKSTSVAVDSWLNLLGTEKRIIAVGQIQLHMK